MKQWKKNSIRKSIENYNSTNDIEHLMDVLRVYEQGGITWHVKIFIRKLYEIIQKTNSKKAQVLRGL